MTGIVIAVTRHLRLSFPQTGKEREMERLTGIVIAVTSHLRPSFPQSERDGDVLR